MTVVDQAATPVTIFDPDVGADIAEAVRGIGITLVLSDGVEEIETGEDGRAVAVRTASGRRLPADVVVLGLGGRPNVELAEKAGIPLGPSGGIAVDHVLATALWNDMDVDQILSMDLSYAPPFSPVWDPVLIAARKAFDAVEADVRADARG